MQHKEHNQYNIISKISLVHNAISVLYCLYLIPNVLNSIKNNNYDNYAQIYNVSIMYFSVSILLNILEKNKLFVFHHIIVIIGMTMPLFCNSNELYEMFYLLMLSEISTLILSIKLVIKNFDSILYNKIKVYLETLFAISFIAIRTFYLSNKMSNFLLVANSQMYKSTLFQQILTVGMKIDLKNYYDIDNNDLDKYSNETIYMCIYLLSIIVMTMNFYWTCAIVSKFYEIFNVTHYEVTRVSKIQ